MKLKESFIDAYKSGPLTLDKLKAANLAWNDVFEELPIRVQNSTLAKALLAQLEPAAAAEPAEAKELQLGSGPMLLKALDFMNEFLDEVVEEQQKVHMFSFPFRLLDGGGSSGTSAEDTTVHI